MTNKTQEEVNAELYERIEKLEKLFQATETVQKAGKQRTLPDLVKAKKFKNGQQKVVIIVAYYEKYGGKTSVAVEDLIRGWRDGKFDGAYARTLLNRAIGEGLVRDLKDGTYDLSQSGEEFYEEFMK